MRQLFIILFSLYCSITFGQQYNSAQESDPKCIALLDQVSTTYFQDKEYNLDYTIAMEIPGYPLEQFSGEITQSGDNYKLTFGNQEVYAFEDTQWTYSKEKNEVLVDERLDENGSVFFTPNTILDFYKSGDFIAMIANSEALGTATRYYVEFKPISTESEYSKIRFEITQDVNSELEKISLFAKDGSKYKITINEIQLLEDLADSTFIFDAEQYPDVHIEDIRL